MSVSFENPNLEQKKGVGLNERVVSAYLITHPVDAKHPKRADDVA